MSDEQGGERGSSEGAAASHPKWPHIVVGSVIVAAMVVKATLPTLWDSPWGASVPNLIANSLIGLAGILTLLWVAFYAPASRRVRLLMFGLLLLPAVAYAATIREVKFTGDMQLLVRHRWEPTDEERLAQHRQQQGRAGEAAAVVAARTSDMPTYRGANAEGVVIGPKLSQDWSTHPPRTVWKQPCGGGYSQFVIVEPFAVTLEQRGANEAIVCYDTASGAERWSVEYPAKFDEAMGGPGPRSTPTIHDGYVYSLGALGDLYKLALADGKIVWKQNILQSHNAPNTEWAVSSSPVVVGRLLIVNPGGPRGNGLEALDLETGASVWKTAGVDEFATSGSKGSRPGYSTPMLATIGGVQQLLMFDGAGLRSYVPETGELLWEYAHENGAGVNVAQPLVWEDGRVFISCSYNVGCAMLKIESGEDGWKVSRLWDNKNLRCKFTSPMRIGDSIYGLDEGLLVCLDPATGKRRWKEGRFGHGQMLLTNDQLVITSEDGWCALIDPRPEGLQEVARFQTLDDPKNWNPPALADGRLYVRNHREMACFDLRAEPQPPTAE